MSGISKRKIFFDVNTGHTDRRGLHQFIEWAIVQTDLGHMIEPHSLTKYAYGTPSLAEYEYDDQISRVDDVKQIDRGEMLFISGDGTQGGTMMPHVERIGR